MTTTRRTLADLDAPYRDAERRITALLCERQSIERDEALAVAHDELRELIREMQLAAFREATMSTAMLGMALRHALAGLDAQAEYYRKVAADERREVAAATKLAIMNAPRIEMGA
jgi:hypothetical protein